MKRIIALATDFGLKSEYAGIMKGVIWSVNPEVEIVDLNHGIDPFDINEAFYILRDSFVYFPKNTVFVAVVDPGVGSDRMIVAIEFMGKVILVPDNGLAWALICHAGMESSSIYSITEKRYFLDNISGTFHGRDVFAPVSAWIASGVQLKNIGKPIDAGRLAPMKVPEAVFADNGSVEGEIVRIDGFGNLMTNINRKMITCSPETACYKKISVEIPDAEIVIKGISLFYAKAGDNIPVAVFGSNGYLEIAVNGSNAMKKLSVSKGTRVSVCQE